MASGKSGSSKRNSLDESLTGKTTNNTTMAETKIQLATMNATKIMKMRGPAPAIPKKGRCESHVYVVFVGQGGCGKSTTLNFLFGNTEISPVERETGTDKIYEFTTPLPGQEQQKLSLIDIPGLGDMNSIEWDGRIIKTFGNYFRNHAELSKVFPNVVIIVGRFDDNRIDGEKSSFVKMLKALDTEGFHLFDKRQSNLIVVLTHYMNGKKALRADPLPRIQLIQNLIRSHLNYKHEVAVILAENEPEDWELEEKGGSFQLKKGVMYPDNVFEQMTKLCESEEDKIGSSVFRTAQIQRKELGELLCQNPIQMDLVDESEGLSMTATLAHIYNSSFSSLMSTLHSRWNSYGKNIDDDQFQKLIQLLSKKGITDTKNIPKTFDESLKIFTNIEKDIYLVQLLEFVKFPIPDYDLSQNSVGAGYNIGLDVFTDNNPVNFDPSQSQYRVSILPHRLPRHIDSTHCKHEQEEVIIFENLKSKDAYTKARLERIKWRQDDLSDPYLVPEGFHFESKPKSGYNYPKEIKNPGKSYGLEHQTWNTFKLKKEFRVAKLEINCPIFNLPVSERSSSAARKLKPYDNKDRSIRSEWRDFFNKWGSHIVKSVYVGGACTVEISESELLRLDANFHSNSSDRQKEVMTWLLTFDENGPGIQCTPPVKYKIKFEGGNNEILEWAFPQTKNQIEAFQNWRADMRRNPIALGTDLELIPIKFLYRESASITQTYDEAFKDLHMTMPSKMSFFAVIAKFFKGLKLKRQGSKFQRQQTYDS